MKKTKTQQLQERVDKIELLRGFKVTWYQRSCWRLVCPHGSFQSDILLQNSRIAELWLTQVEQTGRDNTPLRRFK